MQILKPSLKRLNLLPLFVVWYFYKNQIQNLFFKILYFYKASKYKHIEVVKLLLAKGANIEASADYDEYTPLLCGN